MDRKKGWTGGKVGQEEKWDRRDRRDRRTGGYQEEERLEVDRMKFRAQEGQSIGTLACWLPMLARWLPKLVVGS